MEDKINEFILAWAELRLEYAEKMGYELEQLDVFYGPRWAKVATVLPSGQKASIMAFIDVKTGDIYKPESWMKPALHPRGNVNSPRNGMEAVGGPYSIRYLLPGGKKK